MAGGRVLCGKSDGFRFVKLVGDIRYTMSHDLDDFIEELFEAEDPDRIVFDLTETEQIDSTGLGLLAKAARKAHNAGASRPAIVSCRRDIDTVLSAMGFEGVFDLVRKPPCPLCDLKELISSPGSELETAGVMLDAHKSLAALSEKSKATFEKVVEMLEKDIERKQNAP
ncbi:MAG: STAS domain-containing protein [Planctomycetota bacterium]